MSDKLFTIELECGCLIAEDTGTKKEPDGNAGMLPCYAEYGETETKKGKKQLLLHEKCMKDYFGEKKGDEKK